MNAVSTFSSLCLLTNNEYDWIVMDKWSLFLLQGYRGPTGPVGPPGIDGDKVSCNLGAVVGSTGRSVTTAGNSVRFTAGSLCTMLTAF